jgi:hypothetical protein
MPVQRLVNICPYGSEESKKSCPDYRTNTSCKKDPLICLNNEEGYCEVKDPHELFQYNISDYDVRKIIEERLKQKT